MQLRIRCEVQSEVILQRRLEFKSDDRTYAFETNAKGIWNSLTVLAKIPDPSKVQWGTRDAADPLAPNQAPFNVVVRINPELFDSVISEIQTLESALSLYMPLRQINWRYPEYEPAYERGEERSDLGSVRVSRGKFPPLKMLEKDFVTVLSVALKAQDLASLPRFGAKAKAIGLRANSSMHSSATTSCWKGFTLITRPTANRSKRKCSARRGSCRSSRNSTRTSTQLTTFRRLRKH